jgi:hypothetical protein
MPSAIMNGHYTQLTSEERNIIVVLGGQGTRPRVKVENWAGIQERALP